MILVGAALTARVRAARAELKAVWADGTEADLEDVHRGDYDWMSDDYEVVEGRAYEPVTKCVPTVP